MYTIFIKKDQHIRIFYERKRPCMFCHEITDAPCDLRSSRTHRCRSAAPLLFKTCLTIRLTSQPTWNVTHYRFSTGSECIITSLQVAENDPNLKFIKPRYACSDLSLTRWCLSKNKHSPLKNSKMNCSCFFCKKIMLFRLKFQALQKTINAWDGTHLCGYCKIWKKCFLWSYWLHLC